MQTLLQGTKRHHLCLNIQRRIPELLSRQKPHHVYVIGYGRPLSTTTITTSSTIHVEGDASKTIQDSLPVKPFSAIPGPRGLYNIPHVGFVFHLKPFSQYSIGDIHKFLSEMKKRYGPIFRIQTNVPSVVVTDPKDISTVLQNQGKYPFRPNFDIFDVYYRRTGFRPGLTAIQGEEWWKLREPMQRIALRPKNISRYLPLMEGVSDDFVKMLLSGYLKNRDMDKTFMAFAGESAGTLFFNKRLGFLEENPSQESREILQNIYDLFDVFYKSQLGSIWYKFYRSKEYLRFESAQKEISQRIATHVTQAKQLLEKLGNANVKDSIVMSLLKEGVSEQDVALILESLLSASIDSSAAGIHSALYILSKHPGIQEKVRKDIFSVLCGTVHISNSNNKVRNNKYSNNNKNDKFSKTKMNEDCCYKHLVKELPKDVSKAAINKMHYLKAFLKEVHRFSPLIPIGMIRVLPVDVILGGFTVPAGTQIYTSHNQACQDESIFDNPYEFRPERWLRTSYEGNSSTNLKASRFADSRQNWAVVPFGFGLRSCPGKRIFEHEISLLLTKLLTKTRIGLEPGCEEVEFKYRLFLKAEKTIPFTFTPLDEKREI